LNLPNSLVYVLLSGDSSVTPGNTFPVLPTTMPSNCFDEQQQVDKQ
jgi:hypothetical protein